MIDFSKYSVNEQQAINDVLYDLQKYLYDNDMEWDYLHNALFCSTMQLYKDIDLQAEQAGEAPEQAGEAPELTVTVTIRKPIKVNPSTMYGTIGRPSPADHPADPPAPPDMFGWVGDALDDLCAAGKVIGSD